MFASAWQLLTAIFFLSALTKLVYKLIKQEDPHRLGRRISRSSRRGAPGRARRGFGFTSGSADELRREQQQQQVVDPEASNSSTDDEDDDDDDEDEDEPDQPNEQQQEGQPDEDEEFEEALSQVLSFSSSLSSLPISLEREREERRLRWLARQQFRRQLNRLSGSAVVPPPQASQSSFDDERSLGQRSSSSSGGEFFEAASSLSSLSTSGSATSILSRQQLCQNEQQRRALGGHLPQADGPGDCDENEQQQQQRDCKWQPLSGSSSFANQARRALQGESENFKTEKFHQDQPRKGNAPRTRPEQQQQLNLGTLGQLIAEIFFLEPLKLTCSIVRQSLKTFCAFLDFIEGIEGPLGDENEQEEERAGRAESLGSRVRAGLLRASGRAQGPFGARTGGSQHSPQGAKRKSNYHHRRYFSRRSLSAALLSDDDVDELHLEAEEASESGFRNHLREVAEEEEEPRPLGAQPTPNRRDQNSTIVEL